MPSHDDELNRLLDSLSLETPSESLDLDQETVDTATRFMAARQSPGSPAGFTSQLEESLLQRASMRPVTVGGRIEHVGEGIGLVAIPPMPRRLRIERIAVIAAIALLLLASSSFFRSGSNDGDSWLLAPVASASPVTVAQDCPSRDDYFATYAANIAIHHYETVLTSGITRDVPGSPGMQVFVFPSSFLPSGEPAENTVLASLEQQFQADVACAVAGYQSYDIVSTTQLKDGRVGILAHFVFPDWSGDWYYIYAQNESGWYITEQMQVMEDEEIAQTSTAPVIDSWAVRVWNVTSDLEQTSNMTPTEMRVPSGSEVTFALNNVGTVVEDVSIPDAGVDITLNPGETKTATATFTSGGHKLLVNGEGDTASSSLGFIYAEDTGTGTPVAHVESAPFIPACPDANALQATIEANGLADFEGIQVSAVLGPDDTPLAGVTWPPEVSFQPAPNDPSIRIETLALSDIPQGEPAGPEVWAELTDQIRYDLFCYVTRNGAQLTAPLPITQMTVLPDGRVGVLLDSDPLGFGAQYYMIYVHGSKQWIIDRMSFVLPDAAFVAPPDLPIQTVVLVQGWSVDSDGGYNDYAMPDVFGIPAGTDVTIDVKNLGYDPLTFTITGTDINVRLARGEQQDIIVNLPPGTYRYRFEGPSGSSPGMDPGFLFAVEAPAPVATPTT